MVALFHSTQLRLGSTFKNQVVDYCTIHSIQKVKTTQVSRVTDTDSMVRPDNGTLFELKKKTDTHYNVGEP